MEDAKSDALVAANLSGNLDELLCIEYPANVQNVDKAMAMLGGEKSVARAHYSSTSLALSFRPDDVFCVPATSQKEKVAGLVMKVKRKRKKGNSGWERCETEIVGVVGSKYVFTGMADFQVLSPFSGAYRPDVLHDASLMNDSLPAFLPPNHFTKRDRPLEYSYQTQAHPFRLPADMGGKRILPPKAPSPLMSVEYMDPTVPSAPAVDITDEIRTEHLYFGPLDELFGECPVWTKSALASEVKVTYPTFRNSMPLVSYYFTNGPWKMAFIRFGYDPRKRKDAKIYQMFELRAPRNIDLKSVPHQKDNARSFRSATLTHSDARDVVYSHHYHSNVLPTARTTYYRLCDIKNDEMQQIIHSNDGNEVSCTEEDGWCQAGTYEKLRTMFNDFMLAKAKELNAVIT